MSQSMLSLEHHVSLNQNRWLMWLLADLEVHRGGRFVELVHRLGISRESLARTLSTATDQGWVERNPGHGHPLRPEYVITRLGMAIAQSAKSIVDVQTRLGLTSASLTRWGMPLVCVIDAGEHRFNGMVRRLAPATSRAVSQGLQVLTAEGLVTRDVQDARPPISLYYLTKTGQVLANAA